MRSSFAQKHKKKKKEKEKKVARMRQFVNLGALIPQIHPLHSQKRAKDIGSGPHRMNEVGATTGGCFEVAAGSQLTHLLIKIIY